MTRRTGRVRRVAGFVVPVLVAAALSGGLNANEALAASLASRSGAASHRGARYVISHPAAQQCTPGKYAPGSVHHLTVLGNHPLTVTGGQCFDYIYNPASLLSLDPKADEKVEKTFCSRLDVGLELNKALGHGFISASDFSTVAADPNADEYATKGDCNWSENYLHLLKPKGLTYWRLISVSYILARDADEDYNTILREAEGQKGVTITRLHGIGGPAVELTGVSSESGIEGEVHIAHTILATNGFNVAVLIGDNSRSGVSVLPDVARKALVLAHNL